MITDPIATARLTAREVRNGTRDGQPTKIVVARRTYPTDQADLWNAVTDQERLPRWFAPVTGDFRPGGRFQVEGNAGGVIERCDEPGLLAITWEMGDVTSWVTITLIPDGDGTRLELVHEAPVDPRFWEEFGPGAVGVGWDLALLGLGLHVETGEPVDREIAETLTFSTEGRDFVAESATGWADGAVTAGDERQAADDAAARTIAFYTTDPSEAAEQPS